MNDTKTKVDATFTALEKHLHPLLRSAERMGAMRALLAAATHIQNLIKNNELQPTDEVIQIVRDLDTIRTKIYTEIDNREPGQLD